MIYILQSEPTSTHTNTCLGILPSGTEPGEDPTNTNVKLLLTYQLLHKLPTLQTRLRQLCFVLILLLDQVEWNNTSFVKVHLNSFALCAVISGNYLDN